MENARIAVLGATGEVGRTMLSILAERAFPVSELFLLASERSAGQTVEFGGEQLTVLNVEDFDFSGVDIGLFSAGGSVSEHYAPLAVESGCVVIDNTSRFRSEDDVMLIVPEVNSHRLSEFRTRNIIANPNCSTIQMVVALKPIYDHYGIERIDVVTYQAVSGAGQRAVEELAAQSACILSGDPDKIEAKVFPRRIAFNTLPHIGDFEENGYTQEEMKMVAETRKILDDNTIAVCPTCVRVPVFYGHSEAVTIRTRDPVDAAGVRELLRVSPGIALQDDPGNCDYPTPAFEGNSQDPVYVGRIRNDLSDPHCLSMWIVADNVRKGAALNSIEIAELLLKDYL